MTAKDGHKVDPDAMRAAIKHAKAMLEELESRSGDLKMIAAFKQPAEDEVTTGYVGGGTGDSRGAYTSGAAYQEAFTEQHAYLTELIPRLEQALAQYEADDEAMAQTSNAKEAQL